MQSGRANINKWLLEFEPDAVRKIDPLMGWTGSTDTKGQVRLKFTELDDAVEFATRHHIAYTVLQPHERRLKIKSYAENFK